MFPLQASARASLVSTIVASSVAFFASQAAAHGTSFFTIGCPGPAGSTPPTTLPAAIATANGNHTDDVITLTAGCRYLLTSTLQIGPDPATAPPHNHKVTILGNGATIDGGGTVRVFNVNPMADLTLDRVNVVRGFSTNDGSGIFNDHGTLLLRNSNVLFSVGNNGGGIANLHGITTLVNSNVRHCDGTGTGGGIFNNGTDAVLTIQDLSSVSHNRAAVGGGGITNHVGTVEFESSRLSDNSSTLGGQAGGMSNRGGVATFRRSIVSDNRGNVAGGFLNSYFGTLAGNLVVEDGSIVSDNHSDNDGGGINNSANVTIEHSTIADNDAAARGGGLMNTSIATLTNSRVSDNRSVLGGGIFVDGNASGNAVPELRLTDSVLSHNQAGAASTTGIQRGGGIYNLNGRIWATGSRISHNVAFGDGGGIYNLTTNSNIGTTVTFDDSTLSDNRTIGTNFGGGGIANLGVAEFDESTISDNDATYGGGVLNWGRLELDTHSTLSDNNALTDGGGVWNGVDMTSDRARITDNTAGDSGGAMFNAGRIDLTHGRILDNRAVNHDGGGIFNDARVFPGTGGVLTTGNTVLSTNRAESGGGGAIYNIEGTVTMNHRTRITQNRALAGGGIFNTQGSVTITRGAVSLNRVLGTPSPTGSATIGLGGGILNTGGGMVTLTRCAVARNRASVSGAGIYNDDGGDVSIVETTVAESVANGLGGAIFNSEATVDVDRSTLSGNDGSWGGGVFAIGSPGNNSLVTILNSTLSDNSADVRGGGIFAGPSSNVAVAWSTLMGNDNSPASTFLDGGSLTSLMGGTLTVEHSIVASSRGTHSPPPTGPANSPCFGAIVGSNNLTNTAVASGASCGAGFTVGNPRLVTSLALNPSTAPTMTHALLSGSAAIGIGTSCAGLIDQRSNPRPAVNCDVGAYQTP